MLAVIYTFSKGILALAWSVGVLAFAAGMVLPWRRHYTEAKTVLFLIAVLALAFFAPAMQSDHIEVGADSFHFRTGGWWHPNVHQFAWKDAARIETITVQDRQGRPWEFMRVRFKDGSHDDISIGDVFHAHKDEILQAVSAAIKNAS